MDLSLSRSEEFQHFQWCEICEKIKFHQLAIVKFQDLSLGNHLDQLKPNVAARVCNKQANQKNYHHSCNSLLYIGKTVMALNIREGPKWIPWCCGGATWTIDLPLLVELQGGLKQKRNVDHLLDGTGVQLAPDLEETAPDDTYYPFQPSSSSMSIDCSMHHLPGAASHHPQA